MELLSKVKTKFVSLKGKIKEKFKNSGIKDKIGTKAFLTVGCVTLVGAAVLVSLTLGQSRADDIASSDEGRKVLGNAVLVDGISSPADAVGEAEDNIGEEDFFAMAMLNRTRVRDSALEVLRAIAEDPNALPDAKEDALTSIRSIADEMTSEANIETLVEAKGIAKCVAVISGDRCSVVVNAASLTDEELARITGIVRDEMNIPVANITVVAGKTE